MDTLNLIIGTKEDDPLLLGTAGTDILLGLKGDDVLDGGDGNDLLLGGKGDDLLDGGAGDDFILAGKGDDTANFTLSANLGAMDFYDGGKGSDTLQLTLTATEFESFKGEIYDFETFLAEGGKIFEFSFGLIVRNFEAFNLVTIDDNTAPVADDDSFVFDEDTPTVLDVLANDSDADNDSLSAAIVDRPANGTLDVSADGILTYTPNANFNGTDSFTYQAFDGTEVSNLATVSLTINPVNDDPVAVDDDFDMLAATKSPIKVAVIGGASSSHTLARDQLNDSAVFDFVATAIDYTNSRSWADLGVANYDVVVLGDSGQFDYAGETGTLFTALSTFIGQGGGVITTGFFAFALSNGALPDPVRALADSITPIAPGWTDNDTGGLGAIIKVSDPNHEIVRGVADANNEYVSNASIHEFAPNLDRGIDGNLVVNQLATGTNKVGTVVTAIAYDDNSLGGKTAYLGGAYFGSASGVREGVSDQIFEQAVAWAAGARGTATVNINTADLLANDTDVDSPPEDFTFVSFTQPGADGASIALVDGILVYTLGAQSLQALEAGLPVEDSFEYTMSDGAGGFDTASVTLSIDNLL